MTKQFLPYFSLGLLLTLGLSGTNVWADRHESNPVHVRTEMTIIEAQVLAIDYETREASLELPLGLVVSLTVSPEVQRLEEIKVGDLIVATYLSSLAGEIREPTEEEKKMPWVVVEGEMIAGADQMPGRAGAVTIRAVCTIEGMNRVTGQAMIQDSYGRYHIIEDVPAEHFEGLTLGTTVVITYTQAIAVALEKRRSAEEQ